MFIQLWHKYPDLLPLMGLSLSEEAAKHLHSFLNFCYFKMIRIILESNLEMYGHLQLFFMGGKRSWDFCATNSDKFLLKLVWNLTAGVFHAAAFMGSAIKASAWSSGRCLPMAGGWKDGDDPNHSGIPWFCSCWPNFPCAGLTLHYINPQKK